MRGLLFLWFSVQDPSKQVQCSHASLLHFFFPKDLPLQSFLPAAARPVFHCWVYSFWVKKKSTRRTWGATRFSAPAGSGNGENETEQPRDASVQPSSVAPSDHKKCALICRTTEKFSQGGVTLPEPFPFLLWKCLEREERNENCLLMTVQASVALGNMELMQLQLNSCLLTKSKEGLGSKNRQKEERTPSQEQSSCPFYNHNLQSQNNWELIVGGRHSCLHIHDPLLSGKT